MIAVCRLWAGWLAGWLVGWWGGGNSKLVMNPLKVCVQASTPIGVALPNNKCVLKFHS